MEGILACRGKEICVPESYREVSEKKILIGRDVNRCDDNIKVEVRKNCGWMR
jgi:hypothetical protein